MNSFFTCCLMCAFVLSAKAQTQPASPGTSPYGKVDMADLQMTSCDFEKDANAEVLFDQGNFTSEGSTSLERHKRVKIFNNFGTSQANVRITYISYLRLSSINNLQAETINLENGKIIITKLDPKQVYIEHTDKLRSTLVFALPNVRAGSIIEYKFTMALNSGYFPNWDFQTNIPTRYSEITTDFPAGLTFRVIPHVKQPYAKNIGKSDDYTQIKALANIHSLPDEPYISSRYDNVQRMEYLNFSTMFNSWKKIGELLGRAPDFGQQYNRNLAGEDEILKKANGLKSHNEKISFIFDTVKNAMTWNGASFFFTEDGIVRAWEKKSGNSTEINLILFDLLKKAGIKAYPMIVSTKGNGKLNPVNPNVYIFNSTVVYVPVNDSAAYILDATSKYNLFNQIPEDELNTFGLNLNDDNRLKIEDNTQDYQTIFLQNEQPSMQSFYLNAEVKSDGKMTGTGEINNYSYSKINATKRYQSDGAEKYRKYLSNNNNNIKISAIDVAGMNVDTLPLTQKFSFNADLAGSDENYIYFNTNLFMQPRDNPFKNDVRYSDIDFGYRDNYAVNNIYKLPAGYKIEALPKSSTIIMPDETIVFKRMVAEDNGVVLVKYNLNHKKTIYFKESYEDIRAFYKKMYEMLNEQVVLKKIETK